MPWMRFSADWDWKPRPSTTVAFRSGDIKFVTRACASRALAAGKAESTERPCHDGRKDAHQGGTATANSLR